MDRESAALANALVGKPEAAPVWELNLFGGTFVAEDDGMVAAVGAPCEVIVGETRRPGDGRYLVRNGDRISVRGKVGRGARVVVAWSSATGVPLRLAEPVASLAAGPLNLCPGPQASILPLETLIEAPWTVGVHSDRVGLRLSRADAPTHAHEWPSEPACVGAVQWTPSGTLLIVGPDGPTLGGYPKVGVVAEADLDRLGQLAPGASVEFQAIGWDEAMALRGAAKARLAARIGAIRLHGGLSSR
ncbi:MAG: hypothetical protein AMXMBFR81_14870 [Chthonomonas sp.]